MGARRAGRVGAAPVQTDERTRFAVPPERLWDQLASTAHYQRWWPWLESFHGGPLAEGETWSCTVRPPLPYRVRFSVTFDEVVPGRSASTTIGTDLSGTASFEISPAAGGSELHLCAQLIPTRTLLRTVSTLAHPVAKFGHDWIIGTGLRQFARHLPTQPM